MSDRYWRFGAMERVVLASLLLIQLPLLLLLTQAVVREHGTMTAEFTQALELFAYVGLGAVFLICLARPVAVAGREVGRRLAERVRA